MGRSCTSPAGTRPGVRRQGFPTATTRKGWTCSWPLPRHAATKPVPAANCPATHITSHRGWMPLPQDMPSQLQDIQIFQFLSLAPPGTQTGPEKPLPANQHGMQTSDNGSGHQIRSRRPTGWHPFCAYLEPPKTGAPTNPRKISPETLAAPDKPGMHRGRAGSRPGLQP